MIKKYIRQSDIVDMDATHILLNNGELLDIDHCQLLVPVINRRISRSSANVHLNGSMAAPARPYGYMPYAY